MRGAEGVVLRSRRGAGSRRCRPTCAARHRLAPAGEDLVRVGLVADVPDDAVVAACRTRSAARWSARPCRGWTTGGRRSCDTDSSRNARSSSASWPQLPALERAQLRRVVDGLQQLVHRGIVAVGGSSSVMRAMLEFSQHDEVGELGAAAARARRGRRARHAPRARSSCGERAAPAAGPSSADVGRLVLLRVLAGGLAERRGAGARRRARRRPPGRRGRSPWRNVSSCCAPLRPSAVAAARAQQHRGADQRAGLVDVHELELGHA